MSIRIHKAMGYGWTNVHLKDGEISDPRINSNSDLFNNNKLIKEYYYWLKERKDSENYTDAYSLLHSSLYCGTTTHNQTLCLYTPALYGGEETTTVLIGPAHTTDWYRYDDPIDYCVESLQKEPGVDRVDLIPHGVYPWYGSYMNASTGERVAYVDAEMIRRGDKIVDFDLVPLVPNEFLAIGEFGGLFTDDPQSRLSLRPMILTWWD